MEQQNKRVSYQTDERREQKEREFLVQCVFIFSLLLL
jgi:hypothetical protein